MKKTRKWTIDEVRHTKKEKELFAYLMIRFKLKTDADLANFIYSSTSAISQIRNDHRVLPAKIILVIYDKTGLKIEKIREMAKRDVNEREN